MNNYPNLGPHDAARDDINMEYTIFAELDFTEIDDIAQQLEWESLTSIDSLTTQFHGQHTNQERIDTNIIMEHYLPSEYHQWSTPDASLEPSPQGSPHTSTAASVLETPPMPDYELPADWAAAWDMNTLGMFPGLLDFPRDAELQWPTIDDLCLHGNLGSFPTLEETLQYQQEKETPFSSVVPRSATSAISSSSTTSITSPAEKPPEDTFTCSFCSFTATSITKLKTHMNKHTRPFRCTALSCDYATAEKKSLQRHVLAKAKWDEEHRVAAETLGVKGVKYRCTKVGCEYVTIREDNLHRHVAKCPGKG